MRRQQDDDAPLGKLDQRLLGPAQELVELESAGESPEMNRHEDRQGESRKAMDQRDRLHANTASTARTPVHISTNAKMSAKTSRDMPRQPSHSVSTGRRPIGACTATATTNTV